jgi:hypothetical protein
MKLVPGRPAVRSACVPAPGQPKTWTTTQPIVSAMQMISSPVFLLSVVADGRLPGEIGHAVGQIDEKWPVPARPDSRTLGDRVWRSVPPSDLLVT